MAYDVSWQTHRLAWCENEMSHPVTFKIKRIYDDWHPSDGHRVLVDRLWPRGVRKQDAAIDVWAKNVAPSPGLRKWFNHEPEKFAEFSNRYIAELHANETVLQSVCRSDASSVTLLYAARDRVINHANVLRQFLCLTGVAETTHNNHRTK